MYNVYIDIEITASKHMCGNMYVCQLYLYLCGQVTPASTLSRGSTERRTPLRASAPARRVRMPPAAKVVHVWISCGKGSGIIYY